MIDNNKIYKVTKTPSWDDLCQDVTSSENIHNMHNPSFL